MTSFNKGENRSELNIFFSCVETANFFSAVVQETLMRSSGFVAVRGIVEIITLLPMIKAEIVWPGRWESNFDFPIFQLMMETPDSEWTSFAVLF